MLKSPVMQKEQITYITTSQYVRDKKRRDTQVLSRYAYKDFQILL